MTAHVVAVNVGRRSTVTIRGREHPTGIDKRPAAGVVRVGRGGLQDDVIVDSVHHGGEEKAVYAYAVEDLAWWEGQLGRSLPPGTFGENLTTSGIDVSGAVQGERWQVGTEVVVEVTKPRIPCSTFAAKMGEPRWVRRFWEAGRVGAYLRVIETGEVEAGSPIVVLERPAGAPSVSSVALARLQGAG